MTTPRQVTTPDDQGRERTAARELSFETVAAGLNMTQPIRPSTLRDAVDYLKTEDQTPSTPPDAGQNRQMFPGVAS